ncbi:MAG: hypothetical protein RIR10_909, partial [Planctomycetota bacterium]
NLADSQHRAGRGVVLFVRNVLSSRCTLFADTSNA